MNLKQLIEYLEKKDPDMVVPMGFDDPHSYRGDYMCLAFEPARNVTVGAMLQCARDSVGTVYQGWKGGEYRMVGGTEVYLAMYGCSGEKIGTVLLDYMTGIYDSEECEHLRGVISRTTDEVAGLIAERDHIRTDLLSADADLFEYRKKIVEQSKTIHDLSEEKIRVNRAIEVMIGTISDQNEVIKKQNQTILHIKAELAAAKQFNPFDLVLMAGSIENISNIVDNHFTSVSITDECDGGCAGLCMAVNVAGSDRIEERLKIEVGEVSRLRFIISREHGVAARLQEELDEKDKKIEIYGREIWSLRDNIKGLEAELASVAKSFLDSSESVIDRDDIIEGKVVTISLLKRRVEGQEDTLKRWQEEITSLKLELDIRNVLLMKESLKSSSRLALRQDDEITGLKAEVDRLRSIIHNELWATLMP